MVLRQNVYSIGLITTISINAASDDTQPATKPNGRDSVTILFIAGTMEEEHNQIQIPREFDSIQNALRTCKHRDAISLATPILAATSKNWLKHIATDPQFSTLLAMVMTEVFHSSPIKVSLSMRLLSSRSASLKFYVHFRNTFACVCSIIAILTLSLSIL